MIEFAHFVYVAFLPSITLGIALGVLWRYVEVGRLRTALQWLAALLFFVPQPFALYLGGYSAGLRLYQQALLSLWGFGISALFVSKLLSRTGQPGGKPGWLGSAANWRQSEEEIRRTEVLLSRIRNAQPRRHSKLVYALGAAAMAALGVYCGWNTVGDYLLDHEVVAGRVERARYISHSRSPGAYQLIIDHRAYDITRDLLAQLRPGDYIEADIGVASGTIVAIRRDIRPLQSGLPR